MRLEGKKDVRIDRTQQAIHRAFSELLLEMPYEKISVAELSRRAGINKKTFYRHYASLDELLEEVQLEYARPFAERTAGLSYPEDTDAITREFLLYSAVQGPLYDALASMDMHKKLFKGIMDKMGAERTSQPIPPHGWSQEEWSLYMSHVADSQIGVYRQWVEDGCAVPVNRMVALGVKLVCNGANLERS